MTGFQDTEYRSDVRAAATYARLYALYKRLHDALGVRGSPSSLGSPMKELLQIQRGARAS